MDDALMDPHVKSMEKRRSRSSFVKHVKPLAFESLELTGRDEESKRLREIYESPFKENERIKVVFVSGYSGVGKSALIAKVLKRAAQENGGYFCMGKQEQQFQHELFEDYHHPAQATSFQAISSAVVDLTKAMLNSPSARERIETEMADGPAIGPQLVALLIESCRELTPFFQAITRNDHDQQVVQLDEIWVNPDYRQEQFQLAYRKLLALLCSEEHPVVLAIDDMQWSDSAMLDFLLSAITTDTNIKGLMLVGAYRDNEVDREHPLSRMIKELRQRKQWMENYSVVQMSLRNLDFESLNKVVAHLVEQSDSLSTMELTQVVLSKTHGNIFYALQMMGGLHQVGLVYFDPCLYKWGWELEDIKSTTALTDNVVELVCSKLLRLSPSTQEGLKIASCIGSCFDRKTVEAAFRWRGTDEEPLGAGNVNSNDDEDYDKLAEKEMDFDVAVKIDLLTHFGGTDVYKFSHDKIQQAAYSLFKTREERAMTHYRLGRYFQSQQEGKNPDFILTIAEQLNLGASYYMKTGQDRLELARLNIEAGMLAVKKSGFRRAKAMLCKAFELIPSSIMWEYHFDLAWTTHRTHAEVACILGEYEESLASLDQLLSRARTDEMKLDASLAKMQWHLSRGEAAEIIKLGTKAVRQAGFRLPKKVNVFHLIAEFQRVKSTLKRYTKDELLEMAEIEDEKLKKVCHCLQQIGTAGFYNNEPFLPIFASLRNLRLSLIHAGPCAYTIFGWVGYGIMLVTTGDFDGAYAAGQFAETLGKRFMDGFLETTLYAQLCALTTPLRRPIHENIETCLKYYGIGVESGNLTYACNCCSIYVYTYFNVGLPLEPLVKDCAAVRHNFMKKNESMVRVYLDVYYQAAYNLTGRSQNPYELTGAVLRKEDIAYAELCKNTVAIIEYWTWKLAVCYIMDPEDERTATSARELWKLPTESIKPTQGYVLLSFYSGMAAMTLYRMKRKRKYRKRYKRCIKAIELWQKKGAPWVSHYLLILEAERGWLEGKPEQEVKQKFEIAIRTASRTGFVKDCAIAHERCASFFSSVPGTGDGLSSYHMEKAIQLYQEWGASTKLDSLRIKASLFGTEFSSAMRDKPSSTSLRGRQRFKLLSV